jgi:hypothetical protein
MEEPELDNELKSLREKLPFLWENYGFHLKYFTRDYGFYGKGFVIGLESDICKIVFEKELPSSIQGPATYVGTKQALFIPPNYSYLGENGWYSLTGLIFWLSGVQYDVNKAMDKDLENLREYLKLYMGILLEMFTPPDQFDSKLERLRNQSKENRIAVDMIREEQARLQALGQDSSLEAAIASLRGDKR